MEENINEEWRDVPNYEGLYQVSNFGRVKSLNYNHTNQEKIMKPYLKKDGYYQIGLCTNGKVKYYSIHRLVAIAFIPNPMNLPQVNHKDENKTNNSVDNLEWCTAKYNSNYGSGISRKVANTDYKAFQDKRVASTDWKTKVANTDYKTIAEKNSKPVIQFDLDGNTVAEYPSIIEAERQTEFHHANISRCCLGKAKTCGGFMWKYKE